MLISREAIKTFYNGLTQRMKDFRGNWEQNDSTADDYIKNRPFYQEDDTVEKIYCLPNTTCEFIVDQYCVVSEQELSNDIVVGKSYIVEIDGEVYELTCSYFEEMGVEFIGSIIPFIMLEAGMSREEVEAAFGAQGLEYTNESFCILKGSSSCLIVMEHMNVPQSENEPSTIGEVITTPHTVSIYSYGTVEGKIHKIDKKFLPDTYATLDDVRIAQATADTAQATADTAQATADKKMDATNPIGTGSFSMNRKANTLIGDYSCAEGFDVTASGNCSHAEGYETEASGYNSHAEGSSTKASGPNSHAEGEGAISSGQASHTEGCSTTASGQYSHAEGEFTTANSRGQHVQGGFNIIDTENMYGRGTYAHIVGNGTSLIRRSNAHTIDWDGNAWFSGDVYVGSTSGTNRDDGSKKLATEEFVKGAVKGAKDYIILTDSINSYDYIVQMQNGNLISFCKTSHISATTPPIKTEYVAGDTFDTTGMVITATAQDGSTRVIENYSYPECVMPASDSVEIQYVECDITHTVYIPITVTPFDAAAALVDFEYTANDDGTYTITRWKGTLNGVASTEMVVPDNGLIIV